MPCTKPPGRPKKKIEVLDVSGVAELWDDTDEVRERLRGEKSLVATDPKKGESIPLCVQEQAVLLPLLAKMSLLETKPLPPIEPLRQQVEATYIKNKRGDSGEVGGDVVVEIAWHVQKLLGFVKMKARRRQVSIVTCLSSPSISCS